jgi:hypothetical protein
MSDARIGYGLTLEVGTTTSQTPIYFELAEVTSFQPPQATIDKIDVTHMKSPNRRRQSIPGLTESGEAAATMNYVPGSATDVFLETWRASGETRKVRGTYPDGRGILFTAYVSTYSPDNIPVDGKMVATLNMQVSGDLTQIAAAPPVNQLLPAISGIADVGTTMTALPGQWQGGPTYAYQWQQDNAGGGTWTNISGATGQSYAPVAGNIGNRIRVVVTATNSQGSVSANSAPTIPTVA